MWPTPRKKVEIYFERVLKVTASNDVGCLRATGVFSQAESLHDLPRSFAPPQRGRSVERTTPISEAYERVEVLLGHDPHPAGMATTKPREMPGASSTVEDGKTHLFDDVQTF
jgi:hypothetical protein